MIRSLHLSRVRPALLAAALAALLCAGVALHATPGHAMTVLKVPLSELVKTSELVLHGQITRTRVIDRRAKGLAVFTEFTLRVVEVYKGDAKRVGRTFTWELVGGSTADGLTWSVPGMPTFQQGEEVVVLLEKHARGYTLTGAPQGKFHVFRDAKGISRVHRGLGDVHFVRRDAQGRMVHADSHAKPLLLQPPRFDQPLASLRKEIRGYVALHARQKAAAAKAPTGATAKPRVAVPLPRRALAPRKP